MRPVARTLPAARDGLAVVGECAREALREAWGFPPHLPDAIEEAHLVHAGDTTRVVVEYAIRLGRFITTDDHGGIGNRGMVDLRVLNEERSSFQPLECRPSAYFRVLWVLQLPLAHQCIQPLERGIRRKLRHRSLLFHFSQGRRSLQREYGSWGLMRWGWVNDWSHPQDSTKVLQALFGSCAGVDAGGAHCGVGRCWLTRGIRTSRIAPHQRSSPTCTSAIVYTPLDGARRAAIRPIVRTRAIYGVSGARA